jgi:hypothetical protein
VAFIIGNTFYCSDAPARTSGSPPSSASSDHVDKSIGAKDSPPPPFCLNP